MKKLFRKLISWFATLNPRERVLVGSLAVVAVGFLIALPVVKIGELLEDNARLVASRTANYKELGMLVDRYRVLDSRLARIRESFEKSQMTFEQVYSELDRIIKDSLGSTNYEPPKKSQNPESLGLEFEKQEYSLTIRQATLQQLVKLLYELEQGKQPFYVGKVDILPGASEGTFSANIEIGSVSKKREIKNADAEPA